MKYLLFTVMFIGLVIGLAQVTHYEERMTEYNKYMCAVNGYEADCSTPLSEKLR